MSGRFVSALLLALLAFAGCAARSHPDRNGHPALTGLLVPDFYEEKLYRLYQKRASKDEVLTRLGNQTITPVPNEAFLDTLISSADFNEKTNSTTPATRAKWKQEYRQSAATYYVGAEDANDFLLFFDAAGHLRQYDHF